MACSSRKQNPTTPASGNASQYHCACSAWRHSINIHIYTTSCGSRTERHYILWFLALDNSVIICILNCMAAACRCFGPAEVRTTSTASKSPSKTIPLRKWSIAMFMTMPSASTALFGALSPAPLVSPRIGESSGLVVKVRRAVTANYTTVYVHAAGCRWLPTFTTGRQPPLKTPGRRKPLHSKWLRRQSTPAIKSRVVKTPHGHRCHGMHVDACSTTPDFLDFGTC